MVALRSLLWPEAGPLTRCPVLSLSRRCCPRPDWPAAVYRVQEENKALWLQPARAFFFPLLLCLPGTSAATRHCWHRLQSHPVVDDGVSTTLETKLGDEFLSQLRRGKSGEHLVEDKCCFELELFLFLLFVFTVKVLKPKFFPGNVKNAFEEACADRLNPSHLSWCKFFY